MNPFDVCDCLDRIVLCLDSREHETDQLKRRLEIIGWKHERMALDFGDYSAKVELPNGEWYSLTDKVAIERKQNFTEICGNFCQQRKRFVAEFERAKAAGAKVYILVENANWENAYMGRYRSKMRPSALVASFITWLARYNCTLIFCKAETSGNLIRDILYYEMREHLENLESDENDRNGISASCNEDSWELRQRLGSD